MHPFVKAVIVHAAAALQQGKTLEKVFVEVWNELSQHYLRALEYAFRGTAVSAPEVDARFRASPEEVNRRVAGGKPGDGTMRFLEGVRQEIAHEIGLACWVWLLIILGAVIFLALVIALPLIFCCKK